MPTGLKVVAQAQFKRNPGEVLGDFLQRHPGGPAIGVMDQRPEALRTAFDPLQHHVVVHVPVQHRRGMEVGQLLQRQFDRTRCQADPVGKPDQGLECRSTQAWREAAAHRAYVDIEAVEIGDHRQRGKPAFGNLGLAYQPHPRTGQEAKVEHRPTGSALRTAARTAIAGAIVFR